MSNPAVSIYRNRLAHRVALLSAALCSLLLLSVAAVSLRRGEQLRYSPVWMPVPGSRSGHMQALSAPALGATAWLTDTEVTVLQRVAAQLSCPGDILVDGTVYHLTCVVAAGHSLTVRMQRFATVVEARAAFDTMRGGRPVRPFHCYPSYSWTYDQPVGDLPMRHRIHSWQAERWLVHSEAFDDTGYLVAPEPLHVSELVQGAAVEQSLLPARPCAIQLPALLRP